MARARKEHTRTRQEQLAQAVLELVADGGVRSLSVATVARRVGLVPSAIYRHFAGKEQMVRAAMDLFGRKLLNHVQAARRQQAQPLEQLRDLLRRHVSMIRENLAVPRVLFSEGASPSPAKRQVGTIMLAYLAHVAAIVRAGQRGGSIRRDVQPATVATMFLGLIQPAAMLWHLRGGKFDVDAHARTVWAVFSDAIKAPSSERRLGGA